MPNDLAETVDAGCEGIGNQWIVQSGVRATAQEEPMIAAIVVVIPDDLAGKVDVGSNGGKTDRQGLVESSVIVDRHDLGSLWDRLSCRERRIGKLGRYQTLSRPELHPASSTRCKLARRGSPWSGHVSRGIDFDVHGDRSAPRTDQAR